MIMRKKGVWGAAIAAIVVLGVSALLFVQSHPKQPNGAQPADRQAPLLQFQVTREDISNSIEVAGKSSYVDETAVYVPFTAKIKTWHVKEGAQVHKGDLLFEMDDAALANEISRLESGILKQQLAHKLDLVQRAAKDDSPGNPAASANSGADRLAVYAQNEAQKIEDSLYEESLKVSQNELKEKQEQLKKAEFTAPVDGIFLFNGVKEPQMANQDGDAVGKIVDLSKLQLICNVSEYEVFQIRPGMSVAVRAEALKQTALKGTVERVSKFALPDGGQNAAAQFEVVISLEPNDKLIAGLSLTGQIVTDRKADAIVVPTLAVQRDNDTTFVYIQSGNGIQKKEIQIGLETAEKTEVLDGLKAGDTVVLQ